MEYSNNDSNNDTNNDIQVIRRPSLVRHLNEYKWLHGIETYDYNYLNESNINNNYTDDDGIFFNLVEKEIKKNLNITFHYLIKINDYFFKVVFRCVVDNKFPKIKYITKEEFNNTNNTNDNMLIEKLEIVDYVNNMKHYFIVSYIEHGQHCYINKN